MRSKHYSQPSGFETARVGGECGHCDPGRRCQQSRSCYLRVTLLRIYRRIVSRLAWLLNFLVCSWAFNFIPSHD